MKEWNVLIRPMEPAEYPLLREFLYQAIYVPAGMAPPPRQVVDRPELRIYIQDFGTRPGDCCLAAETEGQVVGAVWSRIMEDYGHIDGATPSLAISLLPEYRRRGMGTALLEALFPLLREKGFSRVSLSVQKENPAVALYRRTGFQTVAERDTEYLMVRAFSTPKEGGSHEKL
jgi:ribosomal-protein-alanine N-acetyltransferase